jgi:hypothetical protein
LPWPGTSLPYPPFAQQAACSAPPQPSKTGKANHELVLRTYGKHDPNKDCASLEPPRINLDQPPIHGVVCLRRTDYTIRWVCSNRSAHCVGRKANGVSVVYLPRHGYIGADTLVYTVHMSPGPVTFNTSLTIEPDAPPSPGASAVPADISAPAGDTPQSPGPIPMCPALMS